uniref:Uncharacterized protein n=1 Tax=Opuntia streptacantha TaxID=393608 RepID=A0A7C9AED9_OPUST
MNLFICLPCRNLQISSPFPPIHLLFSPFLHHLWLTFARSLCVHVRRPLMTMQDMDSGRLLSRPYLCLDVDLRCVCSDVDLCFRVLCVAGGSDPLALPVGLRPLSPLSEYGFPPLCTVALALSFDLSLSTVCSGLCHISFSHSQVRLCSLLIEVVPGTVLGMAVYLT